MNAAFSHLLRRDYARAISYWRREARRDTENSFQLGAICDVGAALILASRYDDARDHFDHLIQEAWRTVSKHFLYRGLIEWYCGDLPAAMTHWRRGLKAQYAQDWGLEVPFLLSFVAAKEPRAPEVQDTAEILRRALARAHGDELEIYLARFLLGELEGSELYVHAFNIEEAANTVRDPTPDHYLGWAELHRRELARIEFYRGVKMLQAGKRASYRTQLAKTLEHAEQSQVLIFEFVLALHETESAPNKRRIRR